MTGYSAVDAFSLAVHDHEAFLDKPFLIECAAACPLRQEPGGDRPRHATGLNIVASALDPYVALYDDPARIAPKRLRERRNPKNHPCPARWTRFRRHGIGD